jgi:hypothetical protein
VRRNFINRTTWVSWADLDTETPYDEVLATQFETPHNIGDMLGNKLKGFFVAPKTSRYRFLMACDDICYFDMATNISDPTNMTRLLYIGSWTSYRSYQSRNGVTLYVSEWQNLTEGQAY